MEVNRWYAKYKQLIRKKRVSDMSIVSPNYLGSGVGPDERYRLPESKRASWKNTKGSLTDVIPHDGKESLSEYINRMREEEDRF